MNRLHVSVRAEPGGTHMLAVWRPALSPVAVAAQRATQAECLALAQRITVDGRTLVPCTACEGEGSLHIFGTVLEPCPRCNGGGVLLVRA